MILKMMIMIIIKNNEESHFLIANDHQILTLRINTSPQSKTRKRTCSGSSFWKRSTAPPPNLRAAKFIGFMLWMVPKSFVDGHPMKFWIICGKHLILDGYHPFGGWSCTSRYVVLSNPIILDGFQPSFRLSFFGISQPSTVGWWVVKPKRIRQVAKVVNYGELLGT